MLMLRSAAHLVQSASNRHQSSECVRKSQIWEHRSSGTCSEDWRSSEPWRPSRLQLHWARQIAVCSPDSVVDSPEWILRLDHSARPSRSSQREARVVVLQLYQLSPSPHFAQTHMWQVRRVRRRDMEMGSWQWSRDACLTLKNVVYHNPDHQVNGIDKRCTEGVRRSSLLSSTSSASHRDSADIILRGSSSIPRLSLLHCCGCAPANLWA